MFLRVGQYLDFIITKAGNTPSHEYTVQNVKMYNDPYKKLLEILSQSHVKIHLVEFQGA